MMRCAAPILPSRSDCGAGRWLPRGSAGRPGVGILLTILLPLSFAASALSAATPQLPPWYDLALDLAAPPESGRPLVLLASLTPLIGDLRGVNARPILPPGWTAEPHQVAGLDLFPGRSQPLRFTLVPPTTSDEEATRRTPGDETTRSAGPGGPSLVSLGFAFTADLPRDALRQAVAQLPGHPDLRQALTSQLEALPARCEGHADLAFALTGDEGFYPLSGDAWTGYDPRLGPAGGRGVVFRQAQTADPEQAREVIDLWQRLQRVLTSDVGFASTLRAGGIDLAAKRNEYLEAIYTISLISYMGKDLKAAAALLDQGWAEATRDGDHAPTPLLVALGNLRALTAWLDGDKRRAEDSLRDSFYHDRRAPVQRYVLRNLGLFYRDRGDRDLARQMYGLALALKPAGYPLLASEAAGLGR